MFDPHFEWLLGGGNRLMTLPSGERIQLFANVHFIFECDTLEYASPATISRCGMIFLSNDSFDVEKIVQKWLVDIDGEDLSGNLTLCIQNVRLIQ